MDQCAHDSWAMRVQCARNMSPELHLLSLQHVTVLQTGVYLCKPMSLLEWCKLQPLKLAACQLRCTCSCAEGTITKKIDIQQAAGIVYVPKVMQQ